MQVKQTRWIQGNGWKPGGAGRLVAKAQLVLFFGSPACLKQTSWQNDIHAGSLQRKSRSKMSPDK